MSSKSTDYITPFEIRCYNINKLTEYALNFINVKISLELVCGYQYNTNSINSCELFFY